MAVNYRDNTPFEGDNHTVGELAKAIRTKMYGVDVRESIAQAVEKMENWAKGNNVGSIVATPTKVFDDLEALQSAYPNGAEGVFLVVEDGHKYIWSNNSWIDAGAYQAADIDETETTKMLHDVYMQEKNKQRKVWQRKLGVNVTTGQWINSQNRFETYAGWCATAEYIPVMPATDYVFAAKDSTSSTANIVGISSVYINLYKANKSFIKQINTSVSSNGKFNTGEASYIRFSMSQTTFGDDLYPSLYIGSTLPSSIDDDVYGLYDLAHKHLANAMSDFKLTSGVSLYKMQNLPLQIYDDNLVEGSTNPSQIKIFLEDNQSNTFQRNASKSGWRIPPNAGDFTLKFNAIVGKSPESYWRYPADLFRKSSEIFLNQVSQNAGNGKKIRTLILGDSLTNFGVYVNRVGELAENDGLNIELIGTRGTSYKHEGRGGWSAKHYRDSMSYNDYDNPFLTDGVFDFGSYMERNGFSGVDLVIINLGTNDVNQNNILTDRNFEQDLDAYSDIIASVKAYNANVKIALGSTIQPARFKNEGIDVKTRRQYWNSLIEKMCKQKGYFYIPYFLVLDPINDFTYEQVAIDDYNSKIIDKVADNTHPANSGYQKMGDLTFAAIKKIASDM